ncbi:MAG: hypothetical protein ACFFD2_13305 [Promethearchaeota archaeon]
MVLRKNQYLEELNGFIKRGHLNAFERLIDRLQDDGISIDPSQIPNIDRKISYLVREHLVPNYNIKEVFRVLQFANDFQLFRSSSKQPLFKLLPQDRTFIISNLQSLFGPLSDGFLEFIVYCLANTLAENVENPNFLSGTNLIENIILTIPRKIEFLYQLIDNYTYSGLRTRKIGTFKQYIKMYKRLREKFNENYYTFEIEKQELSELDSIYSGYFFFFQPSSEKHLIYAPLLEQVKQKYERQEYQYEYPIISMVVHGGTGPEGKGFAYLSPQTAEIIEVCSDAKQTKAYIIEYKKYLKSIFLQKLENHMYSWDISEKLKKEIYNFFNDNIHTKMVGYSDIETLLDKEILDYLQDKIKSYITSSFLAFLLKSFQEILIPVQMEDQFKVRMDLIKMNKLSETEIAKLVSLGNISHFDVLNQRNFFLNLVNNISRIFKKKNLL